MIAREKPRIRVAHVVAGMVPGGVETWLVRVLRHIDRQRFQLDFITHLGRPCFFDNEVRGLGSQIIHCSPPTWPWRYARSFRQALTKYGTYDAVHCHLHHFSGYVLREASHAGVPLRIAHSHSDTRRSQAVASLPRKAYLRTTERWIDRHATRGLAVSEPAGAAMFPRWSRDARWEVLYCGIELEPFRQPMDRVAMRQRLGVPADALVLGHVGALREPKNHLQLLDIAAAVMALSSRAHLLLVGEGPKRREIEGKIGRLGITDRVTLLGLVDDPLDMVRGAMDVFVFPSLWEGLPLAVIEAQAAGLPCVLSDVITPEVAVVDPLVVRVPLAAPASEWAQLILRLFERTNAELRSSALEQVEASSFNIRTSVARLESIYAQR